MKNVTITLDDETAGWARIHAAEQKKSLSRYLGELLNHTMREARVYEEAMERFLSKKPSRLSEDSSYPIRADLYDRRNFR